MQKVMNHQKKFLKLSKQIVFLFPHLLSDDNEVFSNTDWEANINDEIKKCQLINT